MLPSTWACGTEEFGLGHEKERKIKEETRTEGKRKKRVVDLQRGVRIGTRE